MDLARTCIFLEFPHPCVMTGGIEARGAPVPRPDDIHASERRCVCPGFSAWIKMRTGSVTFGVVLCLSFLTHMTGILKAPTHKGKSKQNNLATGVEQLLTGS